MKHVFLSMFLLLSFTQSNAQDILGTDFSYTSSDKDYTFYLNSYFSLGSGGTCPRVKWVLEKQSTDTISLRAIYDLRGHWPTLGCSRTDTIKHSSSISGVNYFNISTNYIIENPDDIAIIDTFWHLYDTTFNLKTSGINEQNVVKSIGIYPNPTNKYLYLGQVQNAKEIVVYNTYGQHVITQSWTERIDVSVLTNGMYFIAVFDKNNSLSAKGNFYKQSE